LHHVAKAGFSKIENTVAEGHRGIAKESGVTPEDRRQDAVDALARGGIGAHHLNRNFHRSSGQSHGSLASFLPILARRRILQRLVFPEM
jgi:hypothetical protein